MSCWPRLRSPWREKDWSRYLTDQDYWSPWKQSVECKHESWVIYSNTTFPKGQCFECGKEISLWILLNNMHNKWEEKFRDLQQRMQTAIHMCEERLAGLNAAAETHKRRGKRPNRRK